jgi:hypothetical protein
MATGLGFLDSTKGPPTRAFVDFVNALPAQGGPLPPKFRPATHVRFMVARSGLRMKFADEAGNGVDPPDGASIGINLMVDRQS